MCDKIIQKIKLLKYRKDILGYAYDFFKPNETFSRKFVVRSYIVVFINNSIQYVDLNIVETSNILLAHQIVDSLIEKGYDTVAKWETWDIEEQKKLLKKRD